MEKSYKQWDEKTNGEKLQSINEYSKSIILKAVGEKKAFWNKDMSVEDIDNSLPFCGSTGKPYSGLTSMLLRCVSEINNYKEPIFLTMKQANFLGGKLKKEVNKKGKAIVNEKTGKEQYVKGLKIAILKKYDYQPKLDSNGNQITKEVKLQNGEIKNEAVMEKVPLKEPIIETTTLYHISQFNDLKIENLKSKNMEDLKQSRENIANLPFDPRPNLAKLDLGNNLTNDLNNFLTAQIKGQNYVKVNTKINENAVKQTKNLNQGMSF